MQAHVNTDLLRLVPAGATHVLVEERSSRGSSVYALCAIVPDGGCVILNGYSSQDLADSTAQAINAAMGV